MLTNHSVRPPRLNKSYPALSAHTQFWQQNPLVGRVSVFLARHPRPTILDEIKVELYVPDLRLEKNIRPLFLRRVVGLPAANPIKQICWRVKN